MFLLAALGCTSDPTFTLALTPVTGTSPDPFEGVDRYDLVVDPGGAAEERIPMTVTGKTAEGVQVPSLAGVRVAVEGFEGDTLRLRGLTEPITAERGKHEETVFVSRAGSATWLPALAEPLYTPMVAALGDGRFWVAGGATNNRSNVPGRSTDVVYDLTLAPPGDLTFAALDTLPEYLDVDDEPHTERVGATATPLSVDGTDAGKLLIVGGASADPLRFDGQSTRAVSLYDPVAETWEDLPQVDTLGGGRVYHLAIENTLGNVIIAGGIGESNGSGASLAVDIEVYDRVDRQFTNAGRGGTLGVLDLFAADLGDEGTLLCGGGSIDGTAYEASSTCVRIPLDGSSVEEFQALPAALVGSAMLRLDDGRILLTGGSTPEGVVSSDADVGARADAWLYNPDTGYWGALSSSMTTPRAMHQMTRLADGRVLIVGGANSYNMDTVPPDGLSCLEVYDPATGMFTSVDACTSAADAGGLPGRTPRTNIANDPEFGVLVVGGVGTDGSAQAGVTFYTPGE
jgi:hypothetical protein